MLHGQIQILVLKIITLHFMVRNQMRKLHLSVQKRNDFSLEGTVMKFVLDNKGQTYYNGALKAVDDDACYDLNTTGLTT
jgi:hypothetical protein